MLAGSSSRPYGLPFAPVGRRRRHYRLKARARDVLEGLGVGLGLVAVVMLGHGLLWLWR